jgi:hypothetical protein
VGNGNMEVGSKTPARESGRPIGEKQEPARKCGAMSEQSADSGRGNEQVPQKLVHLVGYRDPNARPDPWVRPHPIPVKR